MVYDVRDVDVCKSTHQLRAQRELAVDLGPQVLQDHAGEGVQAFGVRVGAAAAQVRGAAENGGVLADLGRGGRGDEASKMRKRRGAWSHPAAPSSILFMYATSLM